MINRKNMKPTITICLAILLAACNTQKKQETDNNSDSLKNIPQAVGNDRDEHGCLASAGYTWSEVQKVVSVFLRREYESMRLMEVNDRLLLFSAPIRH